MKRRRRRKLVVDVPKLLAELGVEVRKSGNEWRGHCPDPRHQAVAGSSAATKSGPGTWQINEDGFHHCYSCKWSGGPINLAAAVLGISGKEAYRWVIGLGGGRLPDRTEVWFERKLAREPSLKFPPGARALWASDVPQELSEAVEYLESRGLTRAELGRWRIAAVPEGEVKYPGRVIVPIIVDGKMVDFVARLFVERSDHIPKALSGKKVDGAIKEYSLWGYDELDPSYDTVHVVEGVWGAVACLHAGVRNVVSCCGSSWSPERTELLAPWSRIVMVPDGDEAGSSLLKRAASLRFRHEFLWAELPHGKQPDHLDPLGLKGLLADPKPVPDFGEIEVRTRRWTGKD